MLRNYPSNKKLIVLLALPRSLSTAFLMSMRAREDTLTLNEPGLRPYNAAVKENAASPSEFTEHILNILPHTFPTYESIVSSVQALQATSTSTVFIKEMIFSAAQYMGDPFFQNAHFFFLVRAPENSLISFYKQSGAPFDTELGDSLSNERMLDFVKRLKSLGRKVHLIRSEDLENAPEKTMRAFCEQAGIEYDPNQLTWDPLPRDANSISAGSLETPLLPGWHDVSKTSAGFDKKHTHALIRDSQGSPTFEEISQEHRQAYIDFWIRQRPFYTQLSEMCMSIEIENSLVKPSFGV